eukprot:Gb_19978 [translate_table: standard]
MASECMWDGTLSPGDFQAAATSLIDKWAVCCPTCQQWSWKPSPKLPWGASHDVSVPDVIKYANCHVSLQWILAKGYLSLEDVRVHNSDEQHYTAEGQEYELEEDEPSDPATLKVEVRVIAKAGDGSLPLVQGHAWFLVKVSDLSRYPLRLLSRRKRSKDVLRSSFMGSISLSIECSERAMLEQIDVASQKGMAEHKLAAQATICSLVYRSLMEEHNLCQLHSWHPHLHIGIL